MTRFTTWILTAALCLLPLTSWAAGYNAIAMGSWATNYSGGCTAGGTFNGIVVPQCTTTTAGGFDMPILITDQSTAAATIAPAFFWVSNVSAVASGNFCFTETFYSQPSDADNSAALSGGTATANISTSVTSDANSVDCHTPANAACKTGSGSAVAVFNMKTAANCASTTCQNVPGWVHIGWLANGSCTGGVGTGKLFNFNWGEFAVQ